MTVAELIAELQKLPPKSIALVRYSDGDLTPVSQLLARNANDFDCMQVGGGILHFGDPIVSIE